MRYTTSLLLSAALTLASVPACADCTDDAADYHQVSPLVLRAMSEVESTNNPNAVHVNPDGTEDVGLEQINEVNFPMLAKYGANREDLLNPCVSLYTAAWMLRKKIDKYGNTWKAVGAYHYDGTKYPQRQTDYANKVRAIVERHRRVGLIRE